MKPDHIAHSRLPVCHPEASSRQSGGGRKIYNSFPRSRDFSFLVLPVLGALSGSIFTVLSALLLGPSVWQGLFALGGLLFGAMMLSAD